MVLDESDEEPPAEPHCAAKASALQDVVNKVKKELLKQPPTTPTEADPIAGVEAKTLAHPLKDSFTQLFAGKGKKLADTPPSKAATKAAAKKTIARVDERFEAAPKRRRI